MLSPFIENALLTLMYFPKDTVEKANKRKVEDGKKHGKEAHASHEGEGGDETHEETIRRLRRELQEQKDVSRRMGSASIVVR